MLYKKFRTLRGGSITEFKDRCTVSVIVYCDYNRLDLDSSFRVILSKQREVFYKK